MEDITQKREGVLRLLNEVLTEVWLKIEEWEKIAGPLVIQLKDAHSSLVLNHRNVAIAQIVGSSVSTGVGVPLLIAGLVLIPFTAGLSLGLTAAGAGVCAAGSMTAGGAAITEAVQRKNAQNSFKVSHLDLQEAFEHLLAVTKELDDKKAELLGLLLESLPSIRFRTANPEQIEPFFRQAVEVSINVLSLAGRAVATVFNIGDDLFRIGATQTVLGISKGATLLSIPARMAVGGAAVGLTLVVDLYTIITSAQTLRGSRKDAALEKLQRTMAEIEEYTESTKKFTGQVEGVRNGDLRCLAEILSDKWPCEICCQLGKPVRCPQCRKLICFRCAEAWKKDCPLCRRDWDHADIMATQDLSVEELMEVLTQEYVQEIFPKLLD